MGKKVGIRWSAYSSSTNKDLGLVFHSCYFICKWFQLSTFPVYIWCSIWWIFSWCISSYENMVWGILESSVLWRFGKCWFSRMGGLWCAGEDLLFLGHLGLYLKILQRQGIFSALGTGLTVPRKIGRWWFWLYQCMNFHLWGIEFLGSKGVSGVWTRKSSEIRILAGQILKDFRQPTWVFLTFEDLGWEIFQKKWTKHNPNVFHICLRPMISDLVWIIEPKTWYRMSAFYRQTETCLNSSSDLT